MDVGCGAQPRIEAGVGHDRHVCVDLSLAGLAQCRQLLGDRGIYVCGSMTEPPLAPGFANTVLMAHCLYHVQRELQPVAMKAIYGVLAPGGELVIMYANPSSLENRVTGPLRALKWRHGTFYFVPLPVGEMLQVIENIHPSSYEVSAMRAVSRVVSQPVFSLFGRLGYRALRALDAMPPRLSTYVSYRLRRA
jgi:SAM-dependent methyltransferase